jgi:hypothetical protein
MQKVGKTMEWKIKRRWIHSARERIGKRMTTNRSMGRQVTSSGFALAGASP